MIGDIKSVRSARANFLPTLSSTREYAVIVRGKKPLASHGMSTSKSTIRKNTKKKARSQKKKEVSENGTKD